MVVWGEVKVSAIPSEETKDPHEAPARSTSSQPIRGQECGSAETSRSQDEKGRRDAE